MFQIESRSALRYHLQPENRSGLRGDDVFDHHQGEISIRFRDGGVFDGVDVVLHLSLQSIR